MKEACQLDYLPCRHAFRCSPAPAGWWLKRIAPWMRPAAPRWTPNALRPLDLGPFGASKAPAGCWSCPPGARWCIGGPARTPCLERLVLNSRAFERLKRGALAELLRFGGPKGLAGHGNAWQSCAELLQVPVIEFDEYLADQGRRVDMAVSLETDQRLGCHDIPYALDIC